MPYGAHSMAYHHPLDNRTTADNRKTRLTTDGPRPSPELTPVSTALKRRIIDECPSSSGCLNTSCHLNCSKMEFRASDDSTESASRSEDPKSESEKAYFGCGNELEEPEYNPAQPKNGAVAPKPNDVRNGDLVSLLLAATPPYLYNIPLVPQTFFFSEMLKSFVQAKTERQNLKAQQSHHRRQRKRPWREITPPKPMSYEHRDKPLELTTPKQVDEKPKLEKSPIKKFNQEGGEKKLSELGNFSVEKLANSSITSGNDSNAVNASSGNMLPPAPPLWYPLLYPPHPPYGIDPLHFFIDLRVSAHFWDKTTKLNNENGLDPTTPLNLHNDPPESLLVGKNRQCSAFRVPSPRKDVPLPKEPRKRSRNVHYLISSLKNIYKTLKKEAQEKTKEEEEEEEGGEKWQKDKDLRALIGLELVVDYVKQKNEGENDKPEVITSEQDKECPVADTEQ